MEKKVIWFISLLGAGILIGGWWYVYIRLKDSNTFELIALKETGNWTNYNVKPFYYYWNFYTNRSMDHPSPSKSYLSLSNKESL